MKKTIVYLGLLILSAVMVSAGDIRPEVQPDVSRDVEPQVTPQETTPIASSGGRYAFCDFPQIDRGTYSIYDPSQKRNIIAGLSSAPCPTLNPEFERVALRFGNHIDNREKDWVSSIHWWSGIVFDEEQSYMSYDKQNAKRFRTIEGYTLN